MLGFRTVTVGWWSNSRWVLDLDRPVWPESDETAGVSGMAVDDPEEERESGWWRSESKGSVKLMAVAVLISSSLIAVKSLLSAPGMADPGVGGVWVGVIAVCSERSDTILALLGSPRPRPGFDTGVLLPSITDQRLDADAPEAAAVDDDDDDDGKTRVDGVGGTLLGEPGTLASEGVESLDPEILREAPLGVR